MKRAARGALPDLLPCLRRRQRTRPPQQPHEFEPNRVRVRPQRSRIRELLALALFRHLQKIAFESYPFNCGLPAMPYACPTIAPMPSAKKSAPKKTSVYLER